MHSKTRTQLLEQYRFEMDPVNGLGMTASSAAIAVNPNMATSTILYLEVENTRVHRRDYAAWIVAGDPFGLSPERCS